MRPTMTDEIQLRLAYLAVHELPAETADEIADRLDIAPSTAYVLLRRLEAVGKARAGEDRPGLITWT